MEAVNKRATEEKMGGFYNRNDLLNRETAQNGGERSDFDAEIFEYSKQNKQIRGVDQNQDSKRSNPTDTNEGTVGSDENLQRNGAAQLEGKKSKNISEPSKEVKKHPPQIPIWYYGGRFFDGYVPIASKI